jgi:nitrous oxidase accessory protein NosD
MTMHMKYVSFALGMLVSVCVIAHAGETTLTVGKPNTDCPNAEYTTIAAAVIAAAPGDIIEICPALYPEQLVISKPLTLRGVRDNVAGNEVNRVLLQPCVEILPGNGFGVLVDSDKPGPFYVAVENNSIHDFTKDGVQAINAGVTAKVEGNRIAGVGPSIAFQFGVFIANGAVGLINGNIITEGPCGSLSPANCLNARSEGVTLKSFGDGTVVSHNVITHAQSGIFINGGNDARISDNFISDIDSLDGIDIQGTASGFFTNSRIDNNTIFNVTPLANEGCGVFEYSGTGIAGNTISRTTVNDAYCGVGFVTADHSETGDYHNTLFTSVNTDTFSYPPPTEP